MLFNQSAQSACNLTQIARVLRMLFHNFVRSHIVVTHLNADYNQHYTQMTTKKNYIAPDIDFEPMVLGTVICESGSLEDYDPITDFTW